MFRSATKNVMCATVFASLTYAQVTASDPYDICREILKKPLDEFTASAKQLRKSDRCLQHTFSNDQKYSSYDSQQRSSTEQSANGLNIGLLDWLSLGYEGDNSSTERNSAKHKRDQQNLFNSNHRHSEHEHDSGHESFKTTLLSEARLHAFNQCVERVSAQLEKNSRIMADQSNNSLLHHKQRDKAKFEHKERMQKLALEHDRLKMLYSLELARLKYGQNMVADELNKSSLEELGHLMPEQRTRTKIVDASLEDGEHKSDLSGERHAEDKSETIRKMLESIGL